MNDGRLLMLDVRDEVILTDVSPLQDKTRLCWIRNGEVADYLFRTEKSDPPTNLEAHVGEYYSPELDTTFRVTAKNDQLLVRHPRKADFTLTPRAPGWLASDEYGFQLIQVTYGDKGEVTGWLASSGRVLELRFEKL